MCSSFWASNYSYINYILNELQYACTAALKISAKHCIYHCGRWFTFEMHVAIIPWKVHVFLKPFFKVWHIWNSTIAAGLCHLIMPIIIWEKIHLLLWLSVLYFVHFNNLSSRFINFTWHSHMELRWLILCINLTGPSVPRLNIISGHVCEDVSIWG